jgi:DNA polymerase-3 subunit alpha
MMGDFVHLHVHSCFSLLDGAADVGPLTQRAKELGMPAIALTDHDGLYGAVRSSPSSARI